MSDDLISRKAVLNILTEARVKDSILCPPAFVEILTQRIKKIPTAFDKEKVIKELRQELNLSDAEKERCARENPLQFDSAKGYANGIANAIEIVKKGGIE